jgi:hypothetical protein
MEEKDFVFVCFWDGVLLHSPDGPVRTVFTGMFHYTQRVKNFPNWKLQNINYVNSIRFKQMEKYPVFMDWKTLDC